MRALKRSENADAASIVNKMGPVQARDNLPRMGISKLRTFLESRVEECYRRNVAKIVPLLQSELRHAENKLASTDAELKALSIDRLKQAANVYREKFAKELAEAIHGSAKASPDEWGETLEGEQLRGGAFLGQEETSSDVWQRALEFEVGDSKRRLYGGAQYHRAIREFTVAVRNMKAPPISEDEIANAAGMGDVHDGVNFMRAACIIAVEKAQQSFSPVLDSLRHRTTHIMRRLFPIVESTIRRSDGFSSGSNPHIDASNGPFRELIRGIYDKFVDQQIESCLSKCKDDLKGMTRFVTWDTDGRGGSAALYKSLPTPKRMVEIYSVAVDNKQEKNSGLDLKDKKQTPVTTNKKGKKNKKDKKKYESFDDQIMGEWGEQNYSDDNKLQPDSSDVTETALAQKSWQEGETEVSEYFELMQLMEEMLAGRQGGRTTTVVITLVQYIISSWRNHFAKTIAMKFNCFFLMPFLDDFPVFLRDELDRMYDEGVGELFDITEARQALQARKLELAAECDANSKLQQRFDLINSQLRGAPHKHVPTAEEVAKSDFDKLDDEIVFDNDIDMMIRDNGDDASTKDSTEVLVNLAARVEEHNQRSGHDYDLEDL